VDVHRVDDRCGGPAGGLHRHGDRVDQVGAVVRDPSAVPGGASHGVDAGHAGADDDQIVCLHCASPLSRAFELHHEDPGRADPLQLLW